MWLEILANEIKWAELKFLGGLKPDKSFVSTNWPFQKDRFIPQFWNNKVLDLKATVVYSGLDQFWSFSFKNRVFLFWISRLFYSKCPFLCWKWTFFRNQNRYWNDKVEISKSFSNFENYWVISGLFLDERNGIMMRPVWKLALEENESVARWILV